MALNGGAIPVAIRLSINGVEQTVQGTMKVAGGLRQLKQAADSTRKGFANLAGAFTGIVAASAVKEMLIAVIKPAMDFQTALSKIQMLAGQSGLKTFREEAMRVAAITPYGPTQMLNVLLKLQRALGDTTAAKKALEPTTQLAMASFGAMTPEKSAEMMAQMARGFGLSGDEMTTAGERVFAASKLAGLGIEDYSKVMGKLATASTLGAQSFDETIKMFSLARREMPSSERAATLLMTVMSELIKPKVTEGLGRLGIATVDAMGHPRRMSEVMLELAERYKGSSREVRNAINTSFGQQAAKPVLAIMNQLTGAFRDQNGKILEGRAAYDHLSSGMRNSKGILKEASDVYKQTAAAQWQEMTETLSNLAIVIGEFLLPKLNWLASGLKGVFESARKFFSTGFGKALGSFLAPALSFVGVVWAGTAALQGLGKIAMVVTANLKPLYAWLTKTATATAGLTTATAVGNATSGAGNIASAIALAAKLKVALTAGAVGLAAAGSYAVHSYFEDNGQKMVNAKLKSMLSSVEQGMTPEQQRKMFGRAGGGSAKYIGEQMMPFAGSRYRELLEEQRRLINEKKAADELSVKASREWYSYIQQGTKQWMDSINAFKGIIDYKPPKLEAGTLYTLQSQFAAVEKRTKGKAGSVDDYNAAVSARAAAVEINRLLGIAATNPKGLSPRQAQTLQNAAAKMTVWGQKLGLGGTDAFRKRFAQQAIQIGSQPNIAFTEAWLQGSAGRMPGAEHMMIPGWSPGVGGYAQPGAKESYDQGFLKNAWGLTQKPGEKSNVMQDFMTTSSRAPDDFLRAAEMAQSKKREDRIAQLDQAMKNILSTLQKLTGTVDGNTIKVKFEGKDPAAGGSSGGSGTDPFGGG